MWFTRGHWGTWVCSGWRRLAVHRGCIRSQTTSRLWKRQTLPRDALQNCKTVATGYNNWSFRWNKNFTTRVTKHQGCSTQMWSKCYLRNLQNSLAEGLELSGPALKLVELDTSRGPFQPTLLCYSTKLSFYLFICFFVSVFIFVLFCFLPKFADSWLLYFQKLKQRWVLSDHLSSPGRFRDIQTPVSWSFSHSPAWGAVSTSSLHMDNLFQHFHFSC